MLWAFPFVLVGQEVLRCEGLAGRVLAERTHREGAGLVFGTVHPCRERTLFVRGGYILPFVIGVAYLVVVCVLSVVRLCSSLARLKQIGDIPTADGCRVPR